MKLRARLLPITIQAFILVLLCFRGGAGETSQVVLWRVPNDGIQPQAAIDDAGTVHLIYYKGAPSGGDLFYVRRKSDAAEFAPPIRVNGRPRTAIAAGTIRGAQMVLGKNGRVHVAWNGVAPESGGYMAAPMYYTRLNDAGTAFEPERDVITMARGLDGGGSIAADAQGNVYVTWHAPKPGNKDGEAGRAVFIAHSSDEGKTFAPEKLATTVGTGACGCCGMKSLADSQGRVFALYRGASNQTNRDEVLLVSRSEGKDFEVLLRDPWIVPTCPMSSAFLAEGADKTWAAWETDGQIRFCRIDSKTLRTSDVMSPPPGPRRRHPVIVSNAGGETLLVWTEGTSWGKGGGVAWQCYDANERPTKIKGRVDGLPAWSLAAALALPDGQFVIIY